MVYQSAHINIPSIICADAGKASVTVQDAALFSTAMTTLAVLDLNGTRNIPLLSILKRTRTLLRLTVLISSYKEEENIDVCMLPHLQ